MNEIYIVLMYRTNTGKPDDPYEYYSCFSNREIAERECKILKKNDERTGDNFTKYIVQVDYVLDSNTIEEP